MKKKYPKETIVDLSYISFIRHARATSSFTRKNQDLTITFLTGIFDETFYHPPTSLLLATSAECQEQQHKVETSNTASNKLTAVNGLALRMYFLRLDDGKGDIRSVKVVKN